MASGSDDYHLAAGDAGAKDYGTDLSGDSFFPFDDDIDGDLFDTWDIGFDENSVAAGGYVPYPRSSGMNGGIGSSMRGGIA